MRGMCLACLLLTAGSAQAADIPRADLTLLMQSVGYAHPWNYDIIAFGDGTPRWAVAIETHPRTLGPDICLASEVSFLVDGDPATSEYTIDPRTLSDARARPALVMALQDCDTVRRNHVLMTSLHQPLSDARIRETADAVRDFLGDRVAAHYDTPELRALAAKVTPADLHDIFSRGADATEMSFFSPDLNPDLIGIIVTRHADGSRDIEVFEENGPDITGKDLKANYP